MSLRGDVGKAPDLSIAKPVNAGVPVVYSAAWNRVVVTSGRVVVGEGHQLLRTLRYRFSYNLRVLPISTKAAQRTGSGGEPVRRYIDNRPARTENGERDRKN